MRGAAGAPDPRNAGRRPPPGPAGPGDEIRLEERRRRLREAAAGLLAPFAATPEPFLLVDPASGAVLDANPAAAALLDRGPAALRALRLQQDDLVAPGSLSSVLRLLERSGRGEAEGPLPLGLLRPGGAVVPVVALAYPLERDGEALTLAILRDRSRGGGAGGREDPAERLEPLGVLAGGIAHDFNNLLTAILGNISLVAEGADDARQRRRLGEAVRACERARELTHKLLAFAEGGAPLPRPLAPGPFLRELATDELGGRDDLILDLRLPASLWTVAADEAQLRPALRDLLQNAREALGPGGAVRVEAANVVLGPDEAAPLAAGPYLRLRIVDEGAGMEPAVLARAFDPYFTTKPGGSGLGLAIAFAVVRHHGGHLSLESAPGAGTTATVLLPAEVETAESTPDPLARPARVLMMDDEELIRSVGELILGDAGYRVQTVADGREALRAWREAVEAGDPFDVVILDLTVPGGMGGKETLDRLKALDPGVRAVVSSGYANDPILGRFRDYGFVGAAAKPYSPRYLDAVVRQALA